ncbi:MAG TPA: amino acid ABC transporter permease [Firmicutes bacterium]|jgi:polar amino acid transport system permease protein|nr:amino acid ABC transporter permease [Bacillota bacterium]
MLRGAGMTLMLTAITAFGGLVFGLVLGLLKTFPHSKIANAIGALYTYVFRGTPLLLQIFIFYFGLPILGFDTSPLQSVSIALVAYSSAYIGEILRGSIQSIDKGQWEASASLAFTYWQQMRRVILPQAFKISIPPLVGFLVSIIKGTSLTSIVGYIELTKSGTIVLQATYQPFLVYAIVCLFYFALCYPLSLLGSRLERRFIPSA